MTSRISSARPAAPVIERLAEGGPVLGLLPAPDLRTTCIDVQAGDLLVLYSDGIVEAVDRHGDEFGERRLLTLVTLHFDQPTAAIASEIAAELHRFTAGARPQDDRTLLVVRF
jgi:sigma-B regulation protein RsbU (phosphoserine phosphatase)